MGFPPQNPKYLVRCGAPLKTRNSPKRLENGMPDPRNKIHTPHKKRENIALEENDA